ncbi:MAG: hypothetical protein JKY03_02685 [Aureispira sp.]|nr:hypothetical protein [Aureispira sp.]
MKKISLFILILVNFFFLSFVLDNGSKDYWETLEKVKLKSTFNPETENFSRKVIFSKKIKKLEGQTIQLKGFVLPSFTKRPKMLSKFKQYYTSCCGGFDYGAMVEYEAKDSIQFNLEGPVVLEGTLRLNLDDPFRHFYILENARCLNCK